MPDTFNFDAVMKGEKRVVLNNLSFDTKNGFIVAVRFHHADDATLQVTVAEEHFIMLNAATAKPAPPLYDLPQPDPSDIGQDQDFFSDVQYMLLGAIFGMLGTILYWRCARMQERAATERQLRDRNDPNQFVNLKAPGMPRTLFNADSDDETDNLKRDLP